MITPRVRRLAGGAGPTDGQETLFRFRRGHARQRPHLGVRELAAGEGLGQERQRPQRARHPHALARRARVEPHTPGEPFGARAAARVPAFPRVELANQIEEAGGRGIEMG